MEPFFIDPEIRRARMLPAVVYAESSTHELLKERVFTPSWQLPPAGLEELSGGTILGEGA